MNQIQPIAAYIPYMTCVGNHENLYNFSNYVYRFSMPSSDGKSIGGDNNHFYSINIGFVSLIDSYRQKQQNIYFKKMTNVCF